MCSGGDQAPSSAAPPPPRLAPAPLPVSPRSRRPLGIPSPRRPSPAAPPRRPPLSSRRPSPLRAPLRHLNAIEGRSDGTLPAKTTPERVQVSVFRPQTRSGAGEIAPRRIQVREGVQEGVPRGVQGGCRGTTRVPAGAGRDSKEGAHRNGAGRRPPRPVVGTEVSGHRDSRAGG